MQLYLHSWWFSTLRVPFFGVVVSKKEPCSAVDDPFKDVKGTLLWMGSVLKVPVTQGQRFVLSFLMLLAQGATNPGSSEIETPVC